jgi:hypothetical protein
MEKYSGRDMSFEIQFIPDAAKGYAALDGRINQPRRRADGVWLILIGMDFMRV